MKKDKSEETCDFDSNFINPYAFPAVRFSLHLVFRVMGREGH
jgi:hypothetical protein